MNTPNSISNDAELVEVINSKIRVEARRHGVDPFIFRSRFVFPYFLRLLFADSSPGESPWLLQGATSLVSRTQGGRFTRDIDLSWAQHLAEESVGEAFSGLIASKPQSGPFTFVLDRIRRTSRPSPDGYRPATFNARVIVMIGGEFFHRIEFDLGVQRHTQLPPEDVLVEPVLKASGLNFPPFIVPAVPIAAHISDKVCAMYEVHHSGASTRYHDLGDIVRIIRYLDFSAENLLRTLDHEARRRGVDLPATMVAPAPEWEVKFPVVARGWAEYPAELCDLGASLALAGTCLNEILSGERTSGQWDHSTGQWNDG